MTVKEIVVKYLQKEGCDGLVNLDRNCSCTIKDIGVNNRNVCHRSLGCDFCLAAVLIETKKTIIEKEMVACVDLDDDPSKKKVYDDYGSGDPYRQLDY